jgi:uncharacterized membrane protein YqjE
VNEADAAPAGIGTLVQRVLGTLADGLCTRAELGATEVQEELLRLVHLLLAAAFTLVLLIHGVVVLIFALAWWAGPGAGAGVLAAGALALIAAAAGTAWWWRRLARARRPLLADTLRELRADTHALGTAR